tara:strand:+ start:43 stop:606 length:564 start_codon:yes stop_codon:yes gene_type:complete
MKTENVIYKMLTENTGVHMCDSGGDNGRHWQQNQKKKLKDFKNESDISYDEDGHCYKSLFHHLVESCEYLPTETKAFETWIKQDKTRYNSWGEVEEFMSEYTHQDKKINTIYTYNDDTVLSQDIQFVYGGDIYDSDVVAISIHNGADARGGLTDYKFFKIDWDQFLNYSSDYYDNEDIKKDYIENRI